jgi:acetoin utilization deacetylase AcuC-like enzyme
MRRAAELLGAPLGIVLEGGYALGALARSVAATMSAMAAQADRGAVAEMAPIAQAARERVAEWWPALAPG